MILLIGIATSTGRYALLPCPSANAADGDDARADKAIGRGIAALKRGDYEQSLSEFLEAQELAPGPRATAMVAQAHQSLKRWADAEINFVEALSAKADPWIQKNRPVLEKLLADVRAELGTLRLVSAASVPTGAAVRVNGELVGLLPIDRPVRVAKGPAAIDVNVAAHEPFRKHVTIAAGQTQTVSIELRPSVPPKPASSIAATQGTRPVPPRPRQHAAAADPLPYTWQDIVGGSALGLGVVALPVGVWGYLATENDDPVRRTSVMAGAAGALALIGAALVLWSQDDKTVALAPTRRGAVLGLRGTW